MANLKAVVRDWRVRNTQPPLRKWPCLVGDGTGVVDDPDRADYVFVRMPDSQVASAYNAAAPLANNDPVWCGYDYININLFQILGLRSVYGAAGFTPARKSIGLHGATHRNLGIDTTPVDGGQFTPGLIVPQTTPDMTVFLPETWYHKASSVIRFDAQNSASLTAYVPSTAGLALWLNISINPATNLAVYTAGSEFTVAFAQDQTVFFATPPANSINLGDILLRWDTTVIEQTNIDCRRRAYFIGGASQTDEALLREVIWFFST